MDIVFLKDCFINKEIAFVLNIPYKISNEINTNNIFFALDNEDKSILEANGLEYLKNYIDLNYVFDYLDSFNREYEIQDREYFERNIEKIKLIPSEKLALSEMLIKVLYSKPRNLKCEELITQAYIDDNGAVWGCCPGWIAKPFGNIIYDEECYNNYYSRIIKLSYLNKTYCFCDFKKCRQSHSKEIEIDENYIKLEINTKPKHIIIATDRSCNLRCNSCRNEFYIPSKQQKEITHNTIQRLLELHWLEDIPFMLAGQGEVFYSEEYLNILKNNKHGKHINILTNAILFDEEKWKLLEGKYDEISINVSVDAARKDTYQKLKHGNFDTAMKKLKLLSEYRKQGKIQFFGLFYVVQKANMKEMVEFVELAKKLEADVVLFTKINNWGTMTNEEYNEVSVTIDDYLDYELYKILSNPIFSDEIIDLTALKGYYEKSKEVYEKSKK